MDSTTGQRLKKIGFGGSCHWCTEAIFQSLKGVAQVDQGWIASNNTDFSEAVAVTFDPGIIPLEKLVEIHLYTHSCTSRHQMRGKYRSAVYVFEDDQLAVVKNTLASLQQNYASPIITEALPFRAFKGNIGQYLNYYYTNPEKPFCKTYIGPKLKKLLKRFGDDVKPASA